MIGINSMCCLIAMAHDNGVTLIDGEGFTLSNGKKNIKLETPATIEQIIATIKELSIVKLNPEKKDAQD